MKHFCVKIGLAALALTCLAGCSSLQYAWQAAAGHWEVLAKSRAVSEVITDEATPPWLVAQLRHAVDAREFATARLHLPDNLSYRRYTDLARRFVVWNVVVTSPDSLVLEKSCFPVTGCVSYRGFFSEQQAREHAAIWRAQGRDVAVIGVPAYSTLGYTPDPLLNTFIRLPAGELARLIFHELAHQVVYIKDDTVFNESFATAVEELGIEPWLTQQEQASVAADYLLFDERRKAFRRLLAVARQDLAALYEGYAAQGGDDDGALRRAKQDRYARLKADYETLKAQWGGWPGYDLYMAEDLNNAKLALAGLYDDYVPAFKALYQRCGQDFPRFYTAVKAVGRMPPQARQLFGSGVPSASTGCPS